MKFWMTISAFMLAGSLLAQSTKSPFSTSSDNSQGAKRTKSPFIKSAEEAQGYKVSRAITASFDLSKVGGIGRIETMAMAEKIWKQFKSTHDFDGVSQFSSSSHGNCPESPLARHAFGCYVKANKPEITLVDLQDCPAAGCNGTGEVREGFGNVQCKLCVGTGKLANIYNYTLLYSAEIAPLPGVSKASPAKNQTVLNALASFCAERNFVPMIAPDANKSEVILGRVEMEYSPLGVIFVIKVIDKTGFSRSSAYHAIIRLMDSDTDTLARINWVSLPVGGGVVKLPLANFYIPSNEKDIGTNQEAQMSVINKITGIRLEVDNSQGPIEGGPITTATSILRPKAVK